MTEKQPPPWGNDLLSTFFADAEYNVRVTALNYPTIYALLRRVDAAFQKLEEAAENDNREELLISRLLMVRTRSSFLAAIRLAMSGQIPESFSVLRAGIEQAWYALHISKDPNPPDRATIWLRRNESDSAKSECKTEFTVKNVRSTHESLDGQAAKEFQEWYERTIDFGAHPNQFSVVTSLTKSENGKRIDYKVGILSPENLRLVFALRVSVAVAVGALKVFQLIYPERFTLIGLDIETQALVADLNTVFKPYLPSGS